MHTCVTRVHGVTRTQLAFAVLACARIGAVHSVVFAGFSPEAIASRISDCASAAVITLDGAAQLLRASCFCDGSAALYVRHTCLFASLCCCLVVWIAALERSL